MVKFCIGIDFSKKTFDATVMEHGKLDGKGIHKVFKNSSQSVQELIQWVKGQTGVPDLGAFVFCGEHTGLYSEAVSDGLAEAGCFMWLENALCIKRARGIARGKSDTQPGQGPSPCRPGRVPGCHPEAVHATQVPGGATVRPSEA